MRSLTLKLSLLTLAVALPLAAADVFLGTWKLDTTKSKYSPGPAPKSLTTVYTADGDWVVLKSDAITADGKSATVTNRYKRDGKDYPFNNPLYPENATVSVKVTDDHHAVATIKRDGSVISTSKTTISKDGKTRTMVAEGTNAEGKKFSNTTVFTRQ